MKNKEKYNFKDLTVKIVECSDCQYYFGLIKTKDGKLVLKTKEFMRENAVIEHILGWFEEDYVTEYDAMIQEIKDIAIESRNGKELIVLLDNVLEILAEHRNNLCKE